MEAQPGPLYVRKTPQDASLTTTESRCSFFAKISLIFPTMPALFEKQNDTKLYISKRT